MALETLDPLPALTTRYGPAFDPIGGGGGFGGLPPITIIAPVGGGGTAGGGGKSGGVGGTVGSAAGSLLSSVLGLPAINWGRIAAFLLGLLFIAGGIYLTKTAQRSIKVVSGHAQRAAQLLAETGE